MLGIVSKIVAQIYVAWNYLFLEHNLVFLPAACGGFCRHISSVDMQA